MPAVRNSYKTLIKRYFLFIMLLIPFLSKAATTVDTSRKRRFLGLSLNYTTTGIANKDGISYDGRSFYISPELHYGSNIIINKKSRALFIRLEATATYNSVDYSIYYPSSGTPYSIQYDIHEFILGYNPQLLYIFHHKNNVKIYAAAGVGLYLVSAGNNQRQTAYPSNIPSYEVGTSYDSQSWYSFGFTSKLGYLFHNRWDAYVSYIGPSVVTDANLLGISPYDPAETGKQSVIKIGINYTLGRK